MRVRQKAIPQEGGQGPRIRSIPPIRARVVQGALTRILAPIFAADFQPDAYGYRPQRAAHDAVLRVAEARVTDKPRVIAVALQASCDPLRHPLLLAKVAQRVNAPEGLQGRKLMRHVSGKQGVAPGGGRAPFLRHLSLTTGDQLLERATEVTRRGPSPSLEAARFADALGIVGDAYPQHDGRLKA